ncbi:TPA: hypothetical protein PJ434_002843, partial [Listeria innocua]|nr:hypothetical protein [Listeria innocua]
AKYLMNPKGIKKKYAFYIDKDIVKLELVDKLFFEIFTKISPFTNMKAPNIISVRELMKSKYLDNTFHHIMFGVGLDKRISNLGEFKNSNKDKFDISREHLENPNVCLNPALCLHCYRLSENKSFKSGELDAYSVLGNCYRDEGGNNNQKERLKEFIMREYVAIGDSEQIKETRKLLLGLMELVFRELSIPVKFKTATDIFFSDSNGAKTFMQLLSASKIEIVYHSRGSNNSFSIGSINSHGSHFTKPYKITMFNNIQVAESLCCGIGYDRLLIALEENLYEE